MKVVLDEKFWDEKCQFHLHLDESVPNPVDHVEMQHRSQCTTPSLSKARRRDRIAIGSRSKLEPVRVGIIADTSSKPWNRLESEGHSPSSPSASDGETVFRQVVTHRNKKGVGCGEREEK